MRTLHEHNIKVPTEVSVVGYDGLDDIIAGNTTPQHKRFDAKVWINELTGSVKERERTP